MAFIPAPLTPLLLSSIILSTNWFSTSGRLERIAPVGKQPGFAIRSASLIRSRFISGRPNTASSSGCRWVIPYHFSYVGTSWNLKSPLKSTTLEPLSRKSGTIFIDAPCGTAQNTTSASTSLFSGFVNCKSRFSRCGCSVLTSSPSLLRLVTVVISTFGCLDRILINSPPV